MTSRPVADAVSVDTVATVALPRQVAPRRRIERALQERIATDPALVGLPPAAVVRSDYRVPGGHGAGLVFQHGRRFTVVEIVRDIGDTIMQGILDRRALLQARRRPQLVVVGERMTVGAARAAQFGGVRFVHIGRFGRFTEETLEH